MVRVLRRLLSLTLAAGLTLMNVQAAELHLHANTHPAIDSHRHGPAYHHHDSIDHHQSDTTEIAAVDADDTVVHVALAATAPPSVKPLCARSEHTPLCDPGMPSIGDGPRIVARAHGPPSLVQHALRAPPALLSL